MLRHSRVIHRLLFNNNQSSVDESTQVTDLEGSTLLQ